MSKSSVKNKTFAFLQDLGKSFMFPVSTLAAMGILVGFGSAFTTGPVLEALPFLKNEFIQVFFSFINNIGGIGFTYLPVLFAMSIPYGLSKRNQAVGSISALIGYVAMHLSINFILNYQGALASPEDIRLQGQAMVLGIQSLEMGVLGGVFVGIIIYLLHEKFQDIQFHDAFSFFAGVRFVPIISIITMSLIGLMIPFIWPLLSHSITGIGLLIQSVGIFGPFLYGFFNSLLKPLGLHHILLALIRFTDAGGTQVVGDERISGALNIFYAQLNSGEPISPQATAFLSQGFMPLFIFALPAVCLAIYHTAYKPRKEDIKGMLISAIFVSVVTGISEPTEFLFLFVAPMLYLFHSIMSGLSLMVVALCGVTIGNTDGGIIDFILFGVMQGMETRWYLIIPIGLVWFAAYYYFFKWYILKYKVQTPGREDEILEEETENSDSIATFSKDHGIYDPQVFINALGGVDNINTLDNCVTRLRMNIEDIAKINENLLKKAGALAVVKLDEHSVQVVIGAQVQSLKTGMEKIINGSKKDI